MKVRFSVVLALQMLFVNAVFCQQEKGQLVLSLGTANNINGLVIQTGSETSKATPVLNLNIDRGMNERFSLGFSYCYQRIDLDRYYVMTTYTTTQNQFGNTITTSTISTDRYTQIETTQNFGARFLFHSNKNSNSDFYGGIKLGYQIGSTKSTMPANVQAIINQNKYNYSYYNSTTPQTYVSTGGDANLAFKNKNRYTQQFILGYRYFWDESFGIFGEGALGFPYFMNIGLCLKI